MNHTNSNQSGSETLDNDIPSKSWWHYGHMWLVVGGPLTVVVASFVTLYFAVKLPDPVVDADYYRKGIEINKTLEGRHDGLVPALQGRNHAATGIKPAAQS